MKLLNYPTLMFVLTVRKHNLLWYNYIVRAARKSPKLCLKVLKEAVQHQPDLNLNMEGVCPFSVCKAVNSGEMTTDTYSSEDNKIMDTLRIKIQNEILFNLGKRPLA